MRSWLIEKRNNKNLTQNDVAAKIGITRQMISAIENGDALPSVKTAKALGNALEFDWTLFYLNKTI